MAIEVKELTIKLSVSEQKPQREGEIKDLPLSLKRQIIAECVEHVLEKLEAKYER